MSFITTNPNPYLVNVPELQGVIQTATGATNSDTLIFSEYDNTDTNSASFNNIKLIQAPAQLSEVISSGLTYDGKSYDIKLYINGVRYYQTSSHFTVTSYTNNTLTLTLSPGFPVDSGDEITITGKFIDIV